MRLGGLCDYIGLSLIVHAPTHKNPHILNYYNSTIMSAIGLVINDLKLQKVLNITATAKKKKLIVVHCRAALEAKQALKLMKLKLRAYLTSNKRKLL